MVSGGISLSAIFITGQVMPQIKPKHDEHDPRADIGCAARPVTARSGFLTELSDRRP